MARRPIFIPRESGDLLVQTEFVDFAWSPGMAVSQKQKSISALHSAARERALCIRPLEVSSKSQNSIGVRLSAFNLKGSTAKQDRAFTVETLFQSSKVFELGGPFRDIISKDSAEAKKDPRLKESGRLVEFNLFGEAWPLEPKTAFYDWVYINTLIKNSSLAEDVGGYDAFTDIEFNPEKSINCQAYSVALFVALKSRGLVELAMKDKESYFKLIMGRPVNNAIENTFNQSKLF